MKKYTNVQVGQRVEHSDLAFGLFESQRQNIQSLMNDLMVGSDSPTKSFVLSGFGASAATTTITVTRGTAIVGFRGATSEFGMLLSDGDATRTVDIASLPDTGGNLYGVYIRFNFEDADYANRQFWNPLAATPVETVRSVPTRKSENWSLAVELTSPGPEWLKIYDVAKSGSSLTLTDVRPLFFDSDATGGALTDSDWGGGNDRNTNRGLYGVRGLYRFVKGTQRQLQDIIGDRWYSAVPSNIISMWAARKGMGFSPVYDSATPPTGDGVTNDATNLALAINNSTESVIDLGGKTYKVNTQMNITRSNITIRNGSVELSNLSGSSDRYGFAFTGSEGADVLVTGSVVAGSTDLEVATTSGLVAGDLVYIVSTDDFATSCKQGELNRVESVTDGTNLVLSNPFLFAMGGTINLRKITPIKNIVMEDMTFLGDIPADVAHYRGAINAFRCENFTVKRCKFRGMYARGIAFQRTYTGKVSECEFFDSTKPDTGFGVDVLDGCFDIQVEKCSSHGMNSLVNSSQTLGGINAGVHVADSAHRGTSAIAFFAANTVGCSVTKSKVLDSGGVGIICAGDRFAAEDCSIQNCTTGIQFFALRTVLTQNYNMVTITGCKIGNCGRGIEVTSAVNAVPLNDVTISDNQISCGIGGYGIKIQAQIASGISNLVLANNTMRSPGMAQDYINITTDDATSFVRGVTATGNNIFGSGQIGISVINVGVLEDAYFIGNTIRGTQSGAFFGNSGVFNRVNFDSLIVGNTGLIGNLSAGSTTVGCSFGGDITATSSSGLDIDNYGTCDQLRLHGRCVGNNYGLVFTNRSTGIAASVSIDAHMQGVTGGLLLEHQGSSTFSNLNISGFAKSTGAGTNGARIATTTATSEFERLNIDMVTEGAGIGMSWGIAGNWNGVSIKGCHAGASDSGLKVFGAATKAARYVSIVGQYLGGIEGVRLVGDIEEASFIGVAKGLSSSGFGFRCGKYTGTLNGYFSNGGTTAGSAAIQINDGASRVTISGFTSGGEYGIDNSFPAAVVLLVGIQSSGVGVGKHTGTFSYGDAATGHTI